MSNKREKSVMELYRENFVQKPQSKFITPKKAREILGLLNESKQFPIVIDENKIKTEREVKSLLEIKSLLIDFIQAWQEVFKAKPMIKNITQVAQGFLSETELKLIYIQVFSIEKKYPEFSINNLLEALSYPDFSQILEASEILNREWFLHGSHVSSIITLEMLFNGGEPAIDEKWIEKLKLKNRVLVRNSEEKNELTILLTFVHAFIALLAHLGIHDNYQYDRLMKRIKERSFINLNNLEIEMNQLQRIIGMSELRSEESNNFESKIKVENISLD